MKRQISRAILGVAVLLVVGLGLPLAVAMQRFYEDRAVDTLRRRAAETVAEIVLPLDRRELASVVSERDTPGPFTVYDGSGRRVFGSGPTIAEDVVAAALRGRSRARTSGDELVVATPLTQRTSEAVVGAVRVSERSSVVDEQVRRAWLAMAAAIALALGAAAWLARWQGRRLAGPVTELSRHAAELGRGELGARSERSGIAEVDTVADALARSGDRLASLLARERAFSADVAHQLRTPLTGLRLTLERLAGDDAAGVELAGLVTEVDRLEATVEHLLALSRDQQPVAAALDVGTLFDGATNRWERRLHDAGRSLDVEDAATNAAARGSMVSMSQVLDVLIDNGLRHGAGMVRLRSRVTSGGVVLEVSDDGEGIAAGVDVFDRHATDGGHGIGLALARSIVEAEGGRLLLATPRPPCFHVVLPTADG